MEQARREREEPWGGNTEPPAKLLQGPDPKAQGAAVQGQPSEASGGPPGVDAGLGSQPPTSVPSQRPLPIKDTALQPTEPQSRGTGRTPQAREAKPGKKGLSPASGHQKRPRTGGPTSAVSPHSPPSGPSPHHPVPCGLGRGPCHLANLLSTLAQDSPDSGLKKGPPEVACQFRKKTRTLYRSDQLEELERAFQEDHYPDSDKRREIAQTVGVAAQRIMVWFQNRRAKWRRVEKVNGKGSQESPPALAPPVGHGSNTAAGPPPAVPLGAGPGGPSQEPRSSAPLESAAQLASERPSDPTQQSEGPHKASVTPPLFSPPPVRRADLPFPLGPIHTPQLMPLLLDGLGNDSGLRDGACGSWGTSTTPPPTCPYLEELEPQGHQQGSFPFPPAPQPPQPLFPYLHPFPTPNSLMPPTLEDTLFPGPYGSHGGPSQSFFPGPSSGPGLLQTPAESTGQVPWSHPCLPDLPLPSSFCTQALGQPSGAEGYFPDDLFSAPYDQAMSGQRSLDPKVLPTGAEPSGAGPLLSKALEGPLAAPQNQQVTGDEARGGNKGSLVP